MKKIKKINTLFEKTILLCIILVYNNIFIIIIYLLTIIL